MTPPPALGPAIKRARERSKMTQRELADQVGVNVKTVDNWENGRTHPKNRLGALEEALSVSFGEAEPRGLERTREEELEHAERLLAEVAESLRRARGEAG
jgi:transcriptional regulator with XRE-family HTH domain